MLLLNEANSIIAELAEKFTFQYASIKLIVSRLVRCSSVNLHFNMLLLNRRLLIVKERLPQFTFQYASIKRVRCTL